MRFPDRACFVILAIILAALGLTGVSQLAHAIPTQVATRRISLSSSGAQANGASSLPSISADGRYVAFASHATNLTPNDTNGVQDVFVHDCLTGATRRVSLSSAGEQGNAPSYSPAISPDGRYIAFVSDATNLVSVDTNFASDIFLHDLQTGQTRRVSIASNGVQPNDHSIAPAVSAGGRYVAFQSYASNLVSGDTNQSSDIFLHDLQTGQTSRVSLGAGGVQGNGSSMLPGLSADGRVLVFRSLAPNLVAQDTNDVADIFVRWLDTGETRRVSLSSSGAQANGDSNAPVISNDGRHVAFISNADNLVSGDTNTVADVFHHDLDTGQTQRISLSSDGVQANDGVELRLSISADGRFVAFASWADNLVSDDTNAYADVFIHDRWSGLTERLSLDSNNQPADRESYHPSLSADGRYAAFDSFASNLTPGDTNAVADVFWRDRGPQPQPTLSANPAVSAPGSFISMEGVNFPRLSLVSLSVNGSPLTPTLSVDSSGYFSFTVDSTLAEPGIYLVRASANPSALAYVILDPEANLVPQQGDAPIVILPSDIGYTQIRYLPLVYR